MLYYTNSSCALFTYLVGRAIVGDPCPGRFGHTAVLSEADGLLYVYGGKISTTAAALNDIYSLDTRASTWAWKKLSVSTAEPRAFHASVLLNDGNLLHIFGMFTRLLPLSRLSLLSVASLTRPEPGKAAIFLFESDVESIGQSRKKQFDPR